ncbi:MAG: Arm DNA-binding domain-containing protein [Bacteroidota bacterium]|nr:Arm DNA-binding domain-containing protein [Bacteroidota bacterium]
MSKTTEHKEGKATVKVVYYTSNTLADGSHPYFLRINKDRKRRYIATGLTLHPKYWNPPQEGGAQELTRAWPRCITQKDNEVGGKIR